MTETTRLTADQIEHWRKSIVGGDVAHIGRAVAAQAAKDARTLAALRAWVAGEMAAASRTIDQGRPESAFYAALGLHAAYRATLAQLDRMESEV